jgi:sec-independent protein translocase protein TatA
MYSLVLLFLSGSDLMLIMFIALLLFGGDKLPEIARGLGKGIRDFKDASEGVKREINNQINSYEEKKAEEAAAKAETPAQGALPPATEQAGPSSELTETGNEQNTPAAEVNPVPNTMPFVENHNALSENYVNGSNVEGSELKEQDKAEQIKHNS